MHRISSLFLLLLSGCMAAYQPHLASPPADLQKYEADLQECITQAQQRIRSAGYNNTDKSMLMGAFGLAGASAIAVTTDQNSDYTKSGYTMTDECLKAKGYTLAQ